MGEITARVRGATTFLDQTKLDVSVRCARAGSSTFSTCGTGSTWQEGANQPRFNQPCSYAATRATAAKTRGIDIFTIAYGVAAARCTYDTSGSYRNAYASTFFANVATDSVDNSPGSCLPTENTDGDHYFCETGSADLEPVFRRIAVAALERTRLVDI